MNFYRLCSFLPLLVFAGQYLYICLGTTLQISRGKILHRASEPATVTEPDLSDSLPPHTSLVTARDHTPAYWLPDAIPMQPFFKYLSIKTFIKINKIRSCKGKLYLGYLRSVNWNKILFGSVMWVHPFFKFYVFWTNTCLYSSSCIPWRHQQWTRCIILSTVLQQLVSRYLLYEHFLGFRH